MNEVLHTYQRSIVFSAAVLQLRRAGFAPGEATTIADHLVRAEARGCASHGLKRIREFRSRGGGSRITPRKTAPATWLLDARDAPGIVAATYAARMAASGARRHGIALAAAHSYDGTTGCIGVYASDLARENLACIALCNTAPTVAPAGSTRRVVGTNPICIGFPGKQFPFVLDIATSAWSRQAVFEASGHGSRLPPGVVQTRSGNPSREPRDLATGSLLPMAGHKGFGLALAIELLCGPMLSSATHLGFIIIAINVGLMSPTRNVVTRANHFLSLVEMSLPASFRIPGRRASERENSGEMSLPVKTATLLDLPCGAAISRR